MKYSFVAKFNPYASLIGRKPEGTVGRVVLTDYEIECENEEEAFYTIVNDLIEAIDHHVEDLKEFINTDIIDVDTMYGQFDDQRASVLILDEDDHHEIPLEKDEGYIVGEFFDIEIFSVEEKSDDENEEEVEDEEEE